MSDLLGNVTTPAPTLAENSFDSLPGVLIVGSLAQGINTTLLEATNVPDGGEDLFNALVLGVPFFFAWCFGIGFVSYYTDDDGYVTGARRVESRFRGYRYLSTILSYAIEGMQIAACFYGPASVQQLVNGSTTKDVLGVWLFRGRDFFVAFPFVAVIVLLMILTLAIPGVLWKLLERDTYYKFAEYYVHGPLGPFISFVQDCFMLYLTIPFFIVLLEGIPCTFYETGEPATALDGTTECGSPDHRRYAISGGIIALMMLFMGSAVGTVPVLVERATDIALNGRFSSLTFAIKCAMACIYVLFADRHEYIHTGSMLVMQCMLLFLNISLRPCLVERINFHRSAAYVLSFAASMMVIMAAGLNDSVNPLPMTFGLVAFFTLLAALLIKYFALPSGKLFPGIPFLGGMYEGGICIGWELPHGYGILRWPEERKTFAGKFLFGKFHGYGVITQDKFFFQGMFSLGLREGFGVTNMMPNEDEKSYEGEWVNDVYHGNGAKLYENGDLYVGDFFEGIEHGNGEWSFDTSLGRHKAKGTFNAGIFTNVQLDEHEDYGGELRYGVPHGYGKMLVDDDIFEGEWRAGKLHGNGVVRIEAGEYDGQFIEGNFNEEGTWRDDHETYQGRWKDGLKHGAGVQEVDVGTYEGQFAKGERQGYGTFTYTDGSVYQGSWQCNDYHGAGLLRSSNGAEYDGNWNQGRRHGTRGCITFPTGETYIGGWSEDDYHGQAILKLPDMGEYNGRFEFGKRHGLGRFTFNDGSEYIGEWADDYAHGEGHFVFSSRKALMVLQIMTLEDAALLQSSGERYFLDYGGVYDGDMAEGTMNGHGSAVCGDGTTYTGEWENGLPHGHGTLTFPGGGQYVGELYAGLRDGIGTMTFEDARLYRGAWESGKRHGTGVLFSAEGDILHDCEWVNDVPNNDAEDETIVPDVPHVDVEELLRAIMPARSSEEEIQETRARRRMEVEELWEAMAIRIWVDEELGYRRIIKAHVAILERSTRAQLVLQEDLESRAAKPFLVKLLNQWKAEFKAYYDREPKKSDIMHDGLIAPFYTRYQELVKLEKGKGEAS